MWGAIELLAGNLGISFEAAIVFIFTMGCLVFSAKDFKLGILMALFINTGIFLWFYATDLNWALPLGLIFMFIIILSFTLYAINKTGQRVGVI